MATGDHPLRDARAAAGLCVRCGGERGQGSTATRCEPCNLKSHLKKKKHDEVDDKVVLLNSPREDEVLAPYKRLACSILMQALDDLLLKGDYQDEAKDAAKAFLLEENPDLPFWCRVAGIQLHHVQKAAATRVRGEVSIQ